MHGIREHPGIVIQGLVKVYILCPGAFDHLPDGLLDFPVVLLCTGEETSMRMAYGGHLCHDETCLGVPGFQTVHEGQVIIHEFPGVMRPVAGVCVVDAQVDDHYVTCKLQGLSEFLLVKIRPVPMPEEGGPGFPEVAHQVAIPQHALQLEGICVLLPVFQFHSIGDAVTHA